MNEGIIQQKTAQTPSTQKPKTMQDYIKRMGGEIAKALPKTMTPERFTRITLSAISSNPKLQETTPQSFLGAMMTAAQLGLEPNTPLGQAYLIPYRNRGTMECQFQLGYKGLIDLAYRSGEVSTIQAQTVYENDDFEYEYGLEPKLKHKPATANRGEPIGFYAVFRTKDNGYGFEYMSIDDVRKHAQRFSKAYGGGMSPWNTNFEEMAKKTVLKRVLKYAPLKTEFARLASTDETIKNGVHEEMFSQPDETVIEAQAVVVDDNGEVIEEANKNA